MALRVAPGIGYKAYPVLVGEENLKPRLVRSCGPATSGDVHFEGIHEIKSLLSLNHYTFTNRLLTHSFDAVALPDISEVPPVDSAGLANLETGEPDILNSLSIWGVFVSFLGDYCALPINGGYSKREPVKLSDVWHLVSLLDDVLVVFRVKVLFLVTLGRAFKHSVVDACEVSI